MPLTLFIKGGDPLKLYEITIKPSSGFGTPLKGDTLFGHFCWQAAYDRELLNGGLERWIACYPDRPFAVFSSAWPKFLDEKGKSTLAVKRPDLPLSMIFTESAGGRREAIRTRKEKAGKKWLLLDESLRVSLAGPFYNNEGLRRKALKEVTSDTRSVLRGREEVTFIKDQEKAHNTINRLTGTTGEGMFSPYTTLNTYFFPETELAVLVLLDIEATGIEKVEEALERIGVMGYGRDASTGCGRFTLGEVEERELPVVEDADACYALGPVVPPPGIFREVFFSPFIRFGRHGDRLATSGNPFRNPVVMADEGAVLIPSGEGVFQRPFIGSAVLDTSKALPETVVQGYAPYLPMKMEIKP